MMIKRALSESGCPPHILDNLMENCHERRWPRGLSSLETRQNNRRIYDNYICRRVPGKNYTFCSTNIYFQPLIHSLFIFIYISMLVFSKFLHLNFRGCYCHKCRLAASDKVIYDK